MDWLCRFSCASKCNNWLSTWGGIEAALSNKSFGLTDNWVIHIKDTYRFHEKELDAITDPHQKSRFVALNVIEQMYDLAKTTIVQNAWKKQQNVTLHGWVYGLDTGIIKDYDVNIKNQNQLKEVCNLSI